MAMLRLSKLTDYGALVLNCMSTSGQAIMSARDLSDRTKVKLPTVSKVLKLLVAADLVASTRGSHGGYRLASGAGDISILRIITALEGTPALTECTSSETICFRDGNCALQNSWQAVNQLIVKLLGGLTLADLAQKIDMNEFLSRMLESNTR